MSSKPGKKDYRLRSATKLLTEEERVFVQEHVRNGISYLAAARRAKPHLKAPEQWVNRLIRKPHIQAAIADEKAAYALATGMTKKKVIDGFLEAIEMARTMAEPMTMVSGWREVGKMCGFYEPTRAELKVTVEGARTLERMKTMTDAELLALTHEEAETIDADFKEVMSNVPAAE